MEVKNEILSIFHEVSTDNVEQSNSKGVFVVANQIGEFVFWWRSYSKPKKNDPNQKPIEIILNMTNIQKVMVNFQESDSYILISTINPSNMYQFTFPPSTSYQLMQLTQILAIKQQMSESDQLNDAMDFISSTYYGSSTPKRLIDLNIDEGRIEFPSYMTVAGFMPQNIDIIQPDLHIASQFGVQSDDFMKNPVVQTDLNVLPKLKILKTLVRNRGASTDIRHIVWPVLCHVLPFDESERKHILKLRTDEYISIRDQWRSYSMLQLKNFVLLRESFSTIRVDVNRTHPPKIITAYPQWTDMLTNILRTFSLWNLDVRYTQGLNDLVVNLMAIFLPRINIDLSIDEVEALTFWCFSSFLEIIDSGITAEDMMTNQMKELKIISEIISRFHPGCADWLKTHNLGDLSFIISSLILAYGRSFAMDDIIRIWEALICSKNPKYFLRYFSASLLIHCFPSISLIPDCSMGKVVSVLDKIFLKQNIGNVIGVAIATMDKEDTHEHAQEGASEENEIVEPKCKFFKLDMSLVHNIREAGKLFI